MIVFFTEPFKLALLVEIKAWKLLFGHSINNKYKQRMDEIMQFVSEYSKRLGRQINDLEDVRNAMAALEDIRQNEIRIDMILGPIEVLLQDNNVGISTRSHTAVRGAVAKLYYLFRKQQRGEVVWGAGFEI